MYNYEVYMISHRASGKRYIGLTSRGAKNRFTEHYYEARKRRWNSPFMQALRKYGKEAFDLLILDTTDCLELASSLERHFIALHNTISPNGYNLTDGGAKDSHLSEESRARVSQSLKGHVVSIETRRRISEAVAKRSYAVLLAEREAWRQLQEDKRKLREQRKEQLAQKRAYRALHGHPLKGTKRPEHIVEKLRIINAGQGKGRKLPESQRAKMKLAQIARRAREREQANV